VLFLDTRVSFVLYSPPVPLSPVPIVIKIPKNKINNREREEVATAVA
jgi:hypothetical protein